ncbi:glycosyltransferase family 2 protein [Brevifollis gellanilyticus]|uniref:Glycosyltransferase 2-like domain-containing protein n=1 Tax=Brevifollis gellanilyticus TaxID=748831 RepID=A0A512M9X2_9BACT|nr:glycosyltransferase [Brevifollis gellanilyticus]GEP43540.1 hypothetical protein BGE01nite_28310 [Brevifollis gellanilyticus]
MITISVLITYHNEREMLRECLGSLQAGKVQPDEILIYDDASTFPPAPFIPAGIRVRVIRGEQNIGPGRGRNVLLHEASSTYVHFHDSDDWFHAQWCEVVRQRLEENPVDALFTEIASSSTGQAVFDHPFMNYGQSAAERDLTAMAIEGGLLVPSATIRRECALKVGGFRAGLWQSEDKDFYIRLAASGVSWAVESRTLVCIRYRTDSRSHDRAQVWKDGLKCLVHASEELPARYHGNVANAAAKCAYQLYMAGERAASHDAFELCERLGGTSYSWRGAGFRLAARLLGGENAEVVSHFLQKIKSLLGARSEEPNAGR